MNSAGFPWGAASRLDRSVFVRPIAHRGLHGPAAGALENTAAAFQAAIARGYGIECDLRPARDGTPVVFHDLELARLVDAPGKTTDYTAAELTRLTYREWPGERVLGLGDFLDLVAARAPLLIEIKSEWHDPGEPFLTAIAAALSAYKGPYAVMSFDPGIVARLRNVLPKAPRGIVSGLYDANWWPGLLSPDRAERLTLLLESGPAAPDFIAYHVNALPSPVVRFVRDAMGLPVLTWTVRTVEQLDIARRWADAPIFEDVDPTAAL